MAMIAITEPAPARRQRPVRERIVVRERGAERHAGDRQLLAGAEVALQRTSRPCSVCEPYAIVRDAVPVPPLNE